MGPFYSTNQRYASSTAILRRRGIPPHIVPMSIIHANRNETDREPAAAFDLRVHVKSDVGHCCMLDDPRHLQYDPAQNSQTHDL